MSENGLSKGCQKFKDDLLKRGYTEFAANFFVQQFQQMEQQISALEKIVDGDIINYI